MHILSNEVTLYRNRLYWVWSLVKMPRSINNDVFKQKFIQELCKWWWRTCQPFVVVEETRNLRTEMKVISNLLEKKAKEKSFSAIFLFYSMELYWDFRKIWRAVNWKFFITSLTHSWDPPQNAIKSPIRNNLFDKQILKLCVVFRILFSIISCSCYH